MSHFACDEPRCAGAAGAVSLLITPRERDLGGFTVRRVLPAPERRAVGPFVFFDEMGPADFPPGQGIQVRPHPHIGLATMTWLFAGEILHRDSLGAVQPIRPGEVNLMTAGRGIVHSERAGEDLHRHARLHGIQTWLALPEAEQEIEPAFRHYGVAELPAFTRDGADIRLVMGSGWGHVSPVHTHSPTFYADIRLHPGACLALPPEVPERALYVVEGAVEIDGQAIARGSMALLEPGALTLRSAAGARVIALGGESLGPRRLWWNFVSTSEERIEQARADWRAGRFPPVPGDDESIPLPA